MRRAGQGRRRDARGVHPRRQAGRDDRSTSTRRPARCSTGAAPARTSSATTGSRRWSALAQRGDRARHPERRRRARRRRHPLDRLRGDHRGLARRRRDHRPGRRDRRRVAAAHRRHPARRSRPRSTQVVDGQPARRHRRRGRGRSPSAAGFSVVREYVGHGIGTAMHEEPAGARTTGRRAGACSSRRATSSPSSRW